MVFAGFKWMTFQEDVPMFKTIGREAHKLVVHHLSFSNYTI